jgi:DNA-binding transcriptional LysR family regulator
MDGEEVEVFLTLASELHFGRTADLLGRSQSRVSRLIRQLEWKVGGPLFERDSRNVRLTPLGTLFRDGIEGPYARLRQGFETARQAAKEAAGTLRIGVTSTTGGAALTRLVERFRSRWPQCHVVLSEVSVHQPYASLRMNHIDVLVNWLAIDEDDLVAGPAIEYRARVVAVSVGHPLTRKRAVSIEDFADYECAEFPDDYPTALGDALRPRVTPSGRRIPCTQLSRSVSEIISRVALGQIIHPTVASLPISHRDDVVLLPVSDMPPLPLGLIWRRAHENQRIRALARLAGADRIGANPQA